MTYKSKNYKKAIAWIAENDEGAELDPEVIQFFVTSLLVADVFNIHEKIVGEDIAKLRKKTIDT